MRFVIEFYLHHTKLHPILLIFDLPQEFVSALEEDLEVNDSAPVVEAIPEGVYDFDASVKDDPHQGTTYVVDTFNYYKNREVNNQATQELQISERQTWF